MKENFNNKIQSNGIYYNDDRDKPFFNYCNNIDGIGIRPFKTPIEALQDFVKSDVIEEGIKKQLQGHKGRYEIIWRALPAVVKKHEQFYVCTRFFVEKL